MKVRVSFSVDIDPEAWTMNYGTPASEIRDDVKEHVRNIATEQLQMSGVLRGRKD